MYGTGKNWLTAVADGINSLLGSGATAGQVEGTIENSKTLTVNVDGTIDVGIYRDQTLVIDKGDIANGNIYKITTNTGNIQVTADTESIANNLVQQRNNLLALISAYSSNPTVVAGYTAELQQVEAQMTALGLATTDSNGTKGFINGYSVPYITVAPIWAQSGTIYISGTSVTGAGKLNAPGNVNVTITNNSPAYSGSRASRFRTTRAVSSASTTRASPASRASAARSPRAPTARRRRSTSRTASTRTPRRT